MTIITLHVTPLSRCIMLAEYGAEPLQLPKKDIITDYLRAATVNKKGYQPRTFKWLSATIDIAVPDNLAPRAAQRNSNVGIALFNYHREVMLRYIDTLHSVGFNASDAMQKFYDHYGLTEWDYSTEAAYRRWVDYKRDTGKKRELNVSQSRKAEITLCSDLLLQKCDSVVDGYNRAVKRIGVRLPTQLRYYILYRYGQYTITRVGHLNGKSKSAVHRGIHAIERRLGRDRLLTNLLRQEFGSGVLTCGPQ